MLNFSDESNSQNEEIQHPDITNEDTKSSI